MSVLSIREMIGFYIQAKVAESYQSKRDAGFVILDCADSDVFVLVSQYLMFHLRCAKMLQDSKCTIWREPDEVLTVQVGDQKIDFTFEIFGQSIKAIPHKSKQCAGSAGTQIN